MRATARWAGLLLTGAAAWATAQEMPRPGMPAGLPDDPIVIRVWSGGDRCSVLNRRAACMRVPGLLLRESQVSRDSIIEVRAEAADEDTWMRATRLATDLRAAGFRRVAPVGRPTLH